jgi:hypothetical protein
MKKKIWFFMIIILSVTVIWYKVPHYKHRTFEGLLFQLGAENAQNVQSVEVEIKGFVQWYFFSPMTFKGTIRIEDELLPPPESPDKELEVKLIGMLNGGQIRYRTDPDDYLKGAYYGILVFNKDFSKMTLLKYEKHGEGSYSWDVGKSMMISAPATNRTEALSIANELMGTALPNPLE